MEKYNILASVQKLIERYDGLSPIFTKYLSEQKLSSEDRNILMTDLSIVLLNDVYTMEIASLFSPILLDLLNRATDATRDDPLTRHEWLCICLSKLIFYFPDVVRFAKLYFEKSYSFFCRFEDGNEPPSKKFKSDMPEAPTYKLLRAANLFLIFDKQAFQDLCDWSILASFVNDRNTFVRWFAYLCLAHLANIRNIHDLMKKKFTKEEYLLCTAEEVECQVWNYTQYRPFRVPSIPEIPHLKPQNIDISKEVVNVEGVLLNRNISSGGCVSMPKYVYVPRVHKYLNRLALAVSAGEPVLLQGPVGCGKTSIIEHLAALTGRKPYEELLKVQLGDHMDSKMLLGTHCCTEVPGEFIWKSGILIQAMTEGLWLLLEDIDCAPMDVISLLVPVIQSGTIILPGHANPIKAAAGFQLFATQRLVKGFEGSYAEFRSHTQIIEKQFRKIFMDPFSKEELRRVIISKWPRMERVCDKILDVYSLFSTDLNKENNIEDLVNEPFNLYCHHGRLVSTRDLFKFCGRIAGKFDSKKDASETVFLNALECFCDSIPEMSTRLTAAESIGVKFNISNAKAKFYCQKSKPTIHKTKNEITIGRVSFPRPPEELKIGRDQQSIFAHTRHASSLLEKIVAAVAMKEPVLLVGETGTGKTSAIQYLADLTKHKLTVINMSQQSDSVDLIGGYKPVDLLYAVRPLKDKFMELFPQQDVVNVDQNSKFMQHISNTFYKKKYEFVAELMLHAQAKILHLLMEKENKSAPHLEQISAWKDLGEEIKTLKLQIKKSKNTLVFKFIEGALVKAMRKGDWLLLDEINLAEAETLECLSGILEKDDNTLFLHEKGSKETVTRHPDFRIFACMNPATDVGKKDLPIGIRNRFTEFFVDEIEEKKDLCHVVHEYLKSLTLNVTVIDDIVDFYLYIKRIASEKLCDGAGSYPHYSLRTLCRALKYASKNPCHNVPRSLYEAFCLSFLSQLDTASHPLVTAAIADKILGKNKLSVLKQSIPEPGNGKYIPIQGYWIHGGKQEPSISENYIFTPTVRQNLQDLARIVSACRFPVLLQGETSVGKTSLIQWLAKASGNICVRVNNHEHTDIQEYIGTYSADATGKLVFKEGILAEAMRNGYWIILDELNLAPTEVMEALNRVLDDNRELFIPETQTLIKAHPGFMIFATQNPPGLYGGRKLLSRAFKNRFIELHFNEIPPPELETILHQRCKLPLSYSKKLVAVMCELQVRRRESGVFYGKQGFITLRDLFRWGERYEKMQEPAEGLDWLQHLADEGYLLLAGRVRHPDEEEVICEVLQKHFSRKVNPAVLFNLSDKTPLATRDILKKALSFRLSENFKNVVWTHNMRRLLVLVGKAIQYKEPVLLIGTTGSGKTTVCQIYAEVFGKSLYSVNCHMHSESADFLGGLRPVRDPEQRESKLFEWVDGPLIQAMQEGNFFLADEISLADDSVLERLNSVLEPEQKILLAERSFDDSDQPEITAKEGFHFMATMNPGGDYGKKELSPALRNRFTEIWCPSSMNNFSDIIAIVEHNINKKLRFDRYAGNGTGFGHAIAEFLNFFSNTDLGQRITLSIRDVLTWVEFVNLSLAFKSRERMPSFEAYIHGAFLAFLDGLGSGSSSSGSEDYILKMKSHCLDFLLGQIGNTKLNYIELMIPELFNEQFENFDFQTYNSSKTLFGFGPFVIDCGPSMEAEGNWAANYVLEAKTPKANLLKILRAMQLPKPILLEGSPGVGKSSLITVLAKASGYNIVRINLSEQTDITDLFGADLPVDGGEKGEFAWRDGPIIQALKKGDWILLDELNLASQSVLEGLNACLDHRNEIYIPELGRAFHLDKNVSRIFCCQNPQRQGGSRKGLPQSFLNRFTQVYMKQMEPYDLKFIASTVYPTIPPHLISAMVSFNNELCMKMGGKRLYGHFSSPWEFNLRDIFRWCDAMIANQNECEYNMGEYVKLIYLDRMRSQEDKDKVIDIYKDIWTRFNLSKGHVIQNRTLKLNVYERSVQLGYSILPRKGANYGGNRMSCITPFQLPYLESLMKCIEMNWMAILVGPSGCGKSTIVRSLAEICGQELHILSVNSEMDTIELLGGFEQANIDRRIELIAQDLIPIIEKAIHRCILVEDSDKKLQEILYRQHVMRQCIFSGLALEDRICIRKLKCLKEVIKTLDSFRLENTNKVLMSCLKSVEDLIKKSRSKESYGGKFEWVDSVLVTAAKKGHWLLIDDANFCSSSVLDRLNGLLEPGGVLTINEQGIVDGELRTIVPHPDFRIILTLNPRNGEISRAMRNRGIEIFIEPIKNLSVRDKDLFNVALFAQCRGLIHDKLLLHFCSLYSNLCDCPDIEPPCISDFISATSLCVQMAQKHGMLAKAFEDSCISVFAENFLNAHARQIALHVIGTEAERVSREITKIDYCIPIHELIPTSYDYCQNIHLSEMKKQTCLYTAYFKGYIGKGADCPPFPEEKDINSAFICPKPSCFSFVQPTCFRNDTRRFSAVMRIIFESCSIESFEYLSYFIVKNVENYIQNFKNPDNNMKTLVGMLTKYQESLKQVSDSSLMTNLSETLKYLFKEAEFSDINSFEAPYDLRWNPSLYQKLMSLLRQKHEDAESIEYEFISRANRCTLLLLYNSQSFANELMPNIPNSKNLAMCAEEVIKNTALYRNSPLLPLMNFPRFIETLNASILKFIQDESMPCSDEYYFKLYEIINSFFYFQRLYLMHAEKGMETALTYLSFHFTWLLKKLHNLYGESYSMPSALAKIAEDTEVLLQCNVPTLKLRQRCMRWFDLPPVFPDDRSAEICRRAVELYETLDMVKRIKSPRTRVKDFKTVIANRVPWFLKLAHSTFTSFYGNDYKRNDYKTALTDVSEIRIQMSDTGIISTDDDDEIMQVAQTPAKLPTMSDLELVMDVQLLPLWDYLFVSYEAELIKNACVLCETRPGKLELDLKTHRAQLFTHVGCRILGLNPVHLAHFSSLLRHKLKKSLAPSLLHFMQHLRHGFSSDGLLSLDFNVKDGVSQFSPCINKHWNEEYSWSKQQPLLTHMYSSLFGNEDSPMICRFPLAMYSEKIQQLKTAQEIVWTHFDQFANVRKNSFRRNSALIVISWFKNLLNSVTSLEKLKADSLNPLELMNLFEKLNIMPLVLTKGGDNVLILTIDAVFELQKKIGEGVEDSNFQWSIGKAYVMVGLLTSLLLMPRDYADPGIRIRTKHLTIKETTQNIAAEVDLRKWVHDLTCVETFIPKKPKETANPDKPKETENPEVPSHPIIKGLTELIEKKKAKTMEMDRRVPFRANDHVYQILREKFVHYLETLGSPDEILDIVCKLNLVNDPKEEHELSQHNLELITRRALQYSQHLQNFADGILREYALYPDLVIPFSVGVEQIIYGLSLSCHTVAIKEAVIDDPPQKLIHINEFLQQYSQFNPGEWNSSLHMVSSLLNNATIVNFKLILSLCKDLFPNRGRLLYKFMKSAILDLINEIKFQSYHPDSKLSQLKDLLFSALQCFYKAWHLDDEIKKKKKAEDESLYKEKSMQLEDQLTDDEMLDKSLKEMFPLYEEEFKDFRNPENLLSDDSKQQDTDTSDESETMVDDSEYAIVFQDEDMFEVCQLHATAVSLLSKSDSSLEKDLFVKCDEKLDFLSPFLLRHEVLSCIITTLGHRLDASFEKHLIGDQMLLSQRLQSLDGMENDDYYDIYHDPNPSRVVTLRPILQKLVNHVNILLEEFPENFNLMQILTITHRVLSFSVSEPLMKFVVGLEIILNTAQVWEQNAHSKVSLKDEINEITRRVIEFRAMELDGWKKGLQTVIKKQYVKSSKWWFFMFPLFYTDNTYADSEKVVIVKGLQQCLEDSPIGEFPARLSILHTFLQEFHLQTPTKLNKCYANILFNVYTYYKQFLPSIMDEISKIRKPLEKELKDYVKIARWNDINFYSVKASVDKSHRFVCKQVKAFEDALKKPAKTVFILPSKRNSVFILPSKKSSPMENSWFLEVEKKHYIYHVPKVRNDIFTERSEAFFQKFPFYQKKMVKKTKQIAENFPVVEHINSLNEFCGNIIEALESVTKDVEKSVCTRSREKKQTLMKIQNKKHMLATLFKDLRSIGLSYRLGIIKYMEDKITKLMSMPSFDIMKMKVLKWDSSFKELVSKSSHDTNHYFYKSLAQYAQLQRFMESPCKDLTLDVIHRIQGYGCHLLNLVSSQRYSIVKMSHGIDGFGSFLSMLSTVFNKQEFAYEKNLTIIPPQLYFQESNINISNLLVIIALAAGQFEALLDCAPEFHTLHPDAQNFGERSLSGIIKGDAAWSQIKRALDVFNCDIKSLLRQLSDLKLSETIVSWDHLRTFSAISKSIQKSMERLMRQISQVCDPECAMTSNLWSLFKKVCHKCDVSREEEEKILDSQMHAEPVKETPRSVAIANLCQKLATQVLLAIQEMVVLSTSEDKSESDQLPDNLFTDKITGFLLEAKKCLRFDKISKIVRKLKSHVSSFQNSTEDLLSNDESFRLLVNLSPLLNQYYQLMKVYLVISLGMHRTSCKFLTILLEVFTILATKGFCIPPELQEEAAKADSTKFEDIESGGFGEGEGSKDVSENIEHEDQLDDANELDQGKKEKEEPKDKDLKDEEQGIEMSNDFEGKLHSGEGAGDSDDEDDDEEEEEESQDLDKQMGDVEADEAGKLDDKVWGDDSDDEEELRKDEESGGVADNAPSELAAKEKHLEDDVEKGGEKENDKGNQPQAPEIDETNEEYTGEKPDPMINAPPTQEPEIEELPENMEITDDVHGDDPGENPEEMEEPTDTLEEPNDEDSTENKENEEADNADGENKAQDPEGESEDKGQNVTDQHEPNEPTDESNMETEERALPSQTPTTQEQAIPSDMKQSSTDPVISEEPMDWENGAQNADEQHKQGLSDAKDMPSDDPGHEGKKTSGMRKEAIELQNARKMKQPGQKRTVDESNDEDVVKKCPIKERKDDKSLETNQDGGKTSEMYEHVSKEEESSARAVDIATKEQAEIRTAQNESQKDEEMEDEQEIIQLSSGDEDDEPCNKSVGETLKHGLNQKAGHSDNAPKEDVDIQEGELIHTQSVARGGESTIHTQNELWKSISSRNIPQGQVRSAANINVTVMDKNASISDELYRQHELAVSNLSQELCEQLRLVLEPTKMSKFKGDYRTGKRLNMRKIIPYIASQFRKDKIWLRRTKPSKRQYQIMLAMDDSSSMADNESKQLAFESLAVLGHSLSLLEAGELSVVSFGENVQLLHGFQDQFSPTAGARIMEQMTFAQKGTKIAQLLNFATDAMIQSRNSSRSTASKETAQLLVIISDGRNIFFEGERKVVAAVKNARDNNVFMVFLILDNPDGNHSILDIKCPIFEGENVTMIPYMDKFPFPFYIILRQITALPQVLGEALRQWFELVTSVDR